MATAEKTLSDCCAGVASRALRLMCYPRLMENMPGHHSVGVRRVRIPGSVACQILYPSSGSKAARQTPYWRPEAIGGLSDYSKLPADLFYTALTHAHHPCLEAPYAHLRPEPSNVRPAPAATHAC